MLEQAGYAFCWSAVLRGHVFHRRLHPRRSERRPSTSSPARHEHGRPVLDFIFGDARAVHLRLRGALVDAPAAPGREGQAMSAGLVGQGPADATGGRCAFRCLGPRPQRAVRRIRRHPPAADRLGRRRASRIHAGPAAPQRSSSSRWALTAIPQPRAQSIVNFRNGLSGRRRSGVLEDAQPVLPQPPRGAATARHQALLAFDAPGKRPGPHVAGDVLSANRAIAGSETVGDSEHAVARKVSRHVGGRRIAWAT